MPAFSFHHTMASFPFQSAAAAEARERPLRTVRTLRGGELPTSIHSNHRYGDTAQCYLHGDDSLRSKLPSWSVRDVFGDDDDDDDDGERRGDMGDMRVMLRSVSEDRGKFIPIRVEIQSDEELRGPFTHLCLDPEDRRPQAAIQQERHPQTDWSQQDRHHQAAPCEHRPPQMALSAERESQTVLCENRHQTALSEDVCPKTSLYENGEPQTTRSQQCGPIETIQYEEDNNSDGPKPLCPPDARDKVLCYLWEVANQDTYLRQRHKFRFSVIPDGNCLYRAVSRAAFGDQLHHAALRQHTVDYISEHLEQFAPLLEGDAGDFLIGAATEGAWGGYPEILAMSAMLGVNILLTTGGSVASPTVSTMVHHLGKEEDCRPVVWLSWLSNGHYDAVLNQALPNPEYQEWARHMRAQVETDEEVARTTVDM
ncbi:uncharacterized protein LOC134441585 isoform X2 [Engraulis encrasicolus]|uniref:uncharacterized protein LOC134441585 isoform X2 n=1 Tax=Engraulis encrasicolus TaxID=184585 RepID=UPI002FD718C3